MKKLFSLLVCLVLVYVSYAQTAEPKNLLHFYVGTYTGKNGSEGIYQFGLDTSTGKLHSNGLSVLSENPSYLALTHDGKFLLAVRETSDKNNQNNGYVELFKVDEAGNLLSVNKVSSAGANPCHVTVNEQGMVLVSNYSGGNVVLMRILPSGELSEVLSEDLHKGSGPVKGRQEGPHVHSALLEPKGKRIFVADLGIDKIKVYTIDGKTSTLKPSKYPEIVLAPGTGPRHMVIHPNGKLLFIANELGCSVITVQLLRNGSYKLLQTISTLPADYKKSAAPADIHLSPDAKFLYVSNRGMNTLAIFAVNEKESNIKLVGHEDTKGRTPRNFTMTPDGAFLLVANQDANNIVVFRRNSETGALTFSDQINAFKPVCLLFK